MCVIPGRCSTIFQVTAPGSLYWWESSEARIWWSLLRVVSCRPTLEIDTITVLFCSEWSFALILIIMYFFIQCVLCPNSGEATVTRARGRSSWEQPSPDLLSGSAYMWHSPQRVIRGWCHNRWHSMASRIWHSRMARGIGGLNQTLLSGLLGAPLPLVVVANESEEVDLP